MYYPWWYVPCLTSPMVIAIIAILHVLVSHYAVGGGILLARENTYAHHHKNGEYRNYWKKHARFFVLLTLVYGAITGVGIWWTIGLASPLATEVLIRTFVFGWAIEWVFFIVEIVAAFGFYYFWDVLAPGKHSQMGWIYAISAWISLVLITGITSFMLNSRSLIGTANGDPLVSFWSAFLNVQFIPQVFARTGGAIVLAALYVYLHSTLTEKNNEVRELVVRRMRFPAIIGLCLMILAMPLWFCFLPHSSLMMLQRAAALNLILLLLAGIFAAILILLIIGPFINPQKMNTCLAVALLFFGISAVAVGEFIREAVRKPFIIDQIVYGNQIYPKDILSMRSSGYLENGIWTNMVLARLQEKYPELNICQKANIGSGTANKAGEQTDNNPILQVQYVQNMPSNVEQPSYQGSTVLPPQAQGLVAVKQQPLEGTPNQKNNGKPRIQTVRAVDVDFSEDFYAPGNADLLKISDEDRLMLGEMIFMYHCNDCHATTMGLSAVGPLLTGKTEEEIKSFVLHLNRPGYYMPPWCGTMVELDLLSHYLVSIRSEMPDNIVKKEKVETEEETLGEKEVVPTVTP